MTILSTNENDRIKRNITIRPTKEIEDFLDTYGRHTVKLFQTQPITHITRDANPCHIRMEDGTLFNFASNAAFFEFLNKAFALGYDFAQKYVCVDFCRWYQDDLKSKLSKVTTAVIGNEDWVPTQEQIDYVLDLEQKASENPCAQVLIRRPDPVLVEYGVGEPGTENARSYSAILDAAELRQCPPERAMELLSDRVFKDVRVRDLMAVIEKETEQALSESLFEDSAPHTFSDKPAKIVQDYIHACRFFRPYAPTMLDYANALLAYRLGYQISQEKVSGRIGALHSLRHEISDYVKNHPEICANLRAEPDVDIFNMTLHSDRLVLRSDYGRVVVTYEPDVTAVEWEKRYTDLRTRHGQR